MTVLEFSMEPREAIRKIITRRNISSRALSNQIDIAEQSVSKMLNGKLTLTDKTLAKMAKALDVPFELVKYGNGLEEYLQSLAANGSNLGDKASDEDNSDQRSYSAAVKDSSQVTKLNGHDTSGNEAEQDQTNVRPLGIHDPDVYQEVKFISYNVWATFTDNFGDFDFQDVKATYPVYLPRLNFPITDRHMVFEILGDSMEERLYNRDVILTELVDDGNFDYLNSHIYVVAYRNQLVVKRVIDNDLLLNGTLTLHSDNKKHGKITIRREDIRYVWKFIAVVYSTAV